MTDAATLRAGPVADAIRRHRLIAILRRIEPQSALLSLVGDLADDGLRIFEITFDSPSAAEDLQATREQLSLRSDGPFVVGAGTLLTDEQVRRATYAGADFGVSPLLESDLVAAALSYALTFIPGAFTPTEMRAAWDAGATFVKLFPASAVGPQFIRELRGPLPQVQIIPTGGVDATNAESFLTAGAVAVGIGSAITRMSSDDRRALVALAEQR